MINSRRVYVNIIIGIIVFGLSVFASTQTQAQSRSSSREKSNISRVPSQSRSSNRSTYKPPTRTSSSKSTYRTPSRTSSPRPTYKPPTITPSRTPSVPRPDISSRVQIPTRVTPRPSTTRPVPVRTPSPRIPSETVRQRTQPTNPRVDIVNRDSSINRGSIFQRKENETTTIRERTPITKIDRTRINSNTSTSIREKTPPVRTNIPASQTSSFVKNRPPQKQYHKPNNYNTNYHNNIDWDDYWDEYWDEYYDHHPRWNLSFNWWNNGYYGSRFAYSGFSYFGTHFSISTSFLWDYPYTYRYPVYTPYVYSPQVIYPYVNYTYTPWWVSAPIYYEPYYNYPPVVVYDCDYFTY